MASEGKKDLHNVSGNWVHDVTETVSAVKSSEEGAMRKFRPNVAQLGFSTIQVSLYFAIFVT